MNKCLAGLAIATLVAVGVLPSLAHEEAVILVGRTAAGDLSVDLDFEQPVELEPSIFPGIPGYATGELALHSTILDDPTHDFYQLSPTANFRFVLVAKDPGMEVWNETGTGYMQTNETFYVGPSPFDTHPIWTIPNGIPGTIYSLTLKLVDLNHTYPDSDPFVLSFTPLETAFSLDLKQTAAQNAVLLWPTNAIGWELQSATRFATTNWVTVTNEPVIIGTNFTLNIVTTEAQQFFRLQKE